MQGYLEPIKARVWTESPVVSNEMMHILLPDALYDILKLSETFLGDVNEVMSSWAPYSKVSPAFLKLVL